jgi:hypothetical protein
MERKGKRKANREKKRLERWTELGKEMDRDTDRKIETVKDKADVKKNRIMKRRGLKDGEKGKREERERERERESFVFFLCVVVFLPFFVCLMLCGSKHRSPSHLLSPLPILQAFRFIRGAQESYPSIPFVVFFFRNSPIIIKSLFAGQSRFNFFFFFFGSCISQSEALEPQRRRILREIRKHQP